MPSLLNGCWRRFAPLSSLPDECAQAAHFCEKFSACRSYRDQVLDLGRELYALDVPVLAELAKTIEVSNEVSHAENIARLYGDFRPAQS